MKIPDRWLMYKKSGRISNTPFVACKTPLREGFSTKLNPETSFTPMNLLQAHPQIKLVIDLTMTTKYYDGIYEFKTLGTQYVKNACQGCGNVPPEASFKKFVETVNKFLQKAREDCLIAVHCTHGINRTGYFIVRYMIEYMGYDVEEALERFHISRGHPIERAALIKDLRRISRKVQRVRETKDKRCVSEQTLDSVKV